MSAIVSEMSSGAVSPRSKVDALSRDDLIRFVKRQIEKLKTVQREKDALRSDLAQAQSNANEAEERWRTEHEKNTEKLEEIEALNKRCNHLERKCSELTMQLEDWKVQIHDQRDTSKKMENCDINNKIEGDAITATEFIELQKELASLKDLLRIQSDKYDKSSEEKEQLTQTVAELRSLLDDAHLQLESYREKRSVENVMTLEMADYERTVERLQKELKVANDEKLSIRSELEASTKKLEKSAEENTYIRNNMTKLKSAVRKVKKELDEKIGELDMAEQEKSNLEKQLEKQICVRNEEREHLMTVIGVNEEKISNLEATNASLNRQLISLRSQCESLQRQFSDLSQEHSSFKARALYVLEQKKSENDDGAKGEIEILEDTILQQKKTIENLTNSHRMLQGELDSSAGHVRTLSAELSSLQRQLSSATEAHQKELAEQRQLFESRLASEAKLNSELLAQVDANFIAHSQEKENLLKSAQQDRESLSEEVERLRHLLDEEVRQRKEVEKMLEAATAQNIAIQLQKPPTNALQKSIRLKRPSTTTTALTEEVIKDIENDESYSEKTLEEVIYGGDEDVNIIDIWNQQDNIVSWQDTAQMTQKQLEHTRELLNESEATNARLVEQTKLLKEEIRRMDRNRERENHLADTEYLKNIIMKFIAPEKVTDERGQLIPVLATILKLSNDEVDLLSRVVQADLATNKSNSSTWATYLWS